MSLIVRRRLAYYRVEKGSSSAAAADSLHIARSHLVNFEYGRRNFTEELLVDLMGYLEVPFEFYQAPFERDLELAKRLPVFLEDVLAEESRFFSEVERLAEKKIQDLKSELSIKYLLSAYYYSRREYHLAEKLDGDCLSIFNKTDDPSLLPWEVLPYFYIQQIEKHKFLGNLNESHRLYLKLKPWVEGSSSLFYVHLKSIRNCLKRGDYQEAFKHSEEIGQLVDANLPAYLQAQLLTVRIAIHIYFNQFFKGEELLKQLKELATVHSLEEFLISYSQHRGYLLEKKGDNATAVAEYEKALLSEPGEGLKIILGISLASNYIHLKNFKKTREMIESLRHQPLRTREQYIISSLEAQLFLYEDKEKDHWKLQRKCIQYFRENGCKRDLEHIYSYLGDYYYAKSKYKKAADFYKMKEAL